MRIAEEHSPEMDTPSRRLFVLGAGLALSALSGPALAQSSFGVGATTSLVTAQEFASFVNQGFLISGAGVTTTMTLVGVTAYDRGTRSSTFRDPFVLLFRAWRGDTPAAGIYQVQDPAGQTVQMFLNPVSADRSVYQASFS